MKTAIGASLLSVLLLLPALPAGGDRKSSQGGYALVAGTVFREPGFALAKATIVLTLQAAADSGRKAKPYKATSDSRGEFVFRVPPGPAEYLLSVTAEGFEPAQRTVRIDTLERVDQYFTLKPAAK